MADNTNATVNNGVNNQPNNGPIEGVVIDRSWSFYGFMADFGEPSIYTNPEEGWTSLCFRKDGTNTFAHFGESTRALSESELIDLIDKGDIRIGLNSNGKYTCYKEGSGANFHKLALNKAQAAMFD